jgi:DNA-binding SARP family transcriptional activator/tetratricopeptide (TPR) repeat protein
MQFFLLGPIEVREEGRIDLGGVKHRAFLSLLLLNANRSVHRAQVIDWLWDQEPPRTAQSLVQEYVSHLRRALRPHGNGLLVSQRLLTRPAGYLLRVEPDELDLHQFQGIVAQARKATATADLAQASGLLHEALALWRGSALEDLPPNPAVMAEKSRLEEARLTALEERIEADLGLGTQAELVSELKALVAAEPLRDRLRAQLMVALYRCGRQAEALGVYRAGRRMLNQQYGLEPSNRLQKLEQAILRDDPVLHALGTEATHPGRPVSLPRGAPLVPRELPGPIAEFSGRCWELGELCRLLGGDGAAGRTSVITVIDGMGGVGKSALAIQAANRLADRFPDGQLYVDLHGATPGQAPLTPMRALQQLLGSLGLGPDAIPGRVEEAAARLRSLAAGRRLLVLFDNAESAAQVRPLLPANPTCAVLVTSRQVLGTLEGAHQLHLDLLPHADALELLGHLCGSQRVGDEPAAAAAVVRLCSRLPLAIRIAGARLAARPCWPIGELADRLADATRRLDELTTEGLAVRAAFDVSLEALVASRDPVDRAAATAFGLLSLPDGPDLDVGSAARLLDRPEPATGQLLERLVDAHLLETLRPSRYQFHDLVRLHARQRAARHHPDRERLEALGRLWSFYTATAWHTLALLRPGDSRLAGAARPWTQGGWRFGDVAAALSWLEDERSNLLAAIAQAAAAVPGIPAKLPGQLARALYAYFNACGYWADCFEANQAVLPVMLRTGDQAARANALNDIGVASEQLGRYQEAIARHQESLAIRRKLDDLKGQAASLGNAGRALQRLGRHQDAITSLQQALAVNRLLGDRRGQAANLGNLGTAHERLGRYQDAIGYLEQSLAHFEQGGERHGVASILSDMGRVYERLGRYQEALASLQRCLELSRELGDEVEKALSLHALGRVHRSLGRHQEAIACHLESVTLLRKLEYRPPLSQALLDLGDVLLDAGRPHQARRCWQEALANCEALGGPEAEEACERLAALSSNAD